MAWDALCWPRVTCFWVTALAQSVTPVSLSSSHLALDGHCSPLLPPDRHTLDAGRAQTGLTRLAPCSSSFFGHPGGTTAIPKAFAEMDSLPLLASSCLPARLVLLARSVLLPPSLRQRLSRTLGQNVCPPCSSLHRSQLSTHLSASPTLCTLYCLYSL